MPLILMSGYPSSGKTFRSNQIKAYLEEKIASLPENERSRLSVVHISDASLNIPRTVYAAAREEKDARGALASAVKRALGRDVIVIADAMNYIKGFRYQLYCEAKAARTASCVVHVGTPESAARSQNEAALASGTGGYESDLFENLVFRYEEPNGMSRWDSPLFIIAHEDKGPPNEAIWEALMGEEGKGKMIRPNQSTVLPSSTSSDALYTLERATSSVVSQIMAYLKDHPSETGGTVPLSDLSEPVRLPTGAAVSLPQLQRLKRQFIQMRRSQIGSTQGMQSEVDDKVIGASFVGFLNGTWASV